VALTRVSDPPARIDTTVVSPEAGVARGVRNGPLRLFIAAYVVSGFGFGMALTLNYVYMQSIVGLAGRIPLVYVLSSPAALWASRSGAGWEAATESASSGCACDRRRRG
jgi:hypothetical protein